MLNRVGQQLGNYRLISRLAHGGFAEVYLGEHIHLGTHAAIKVLHAQLTSEDLAQFRAEARSIAHLRHPHIVSIFDFDVEEDVFFLVMDYAPNGTLRQRHPKGTTLPPTTILPYLRHIAEALQYAHDECLIHRDVKPENMLIGRHNEILLSDFGIAVVASATTRDVVGTPVYMAPEQLQGKPLPVSDQYSLAVVVYEWLCGSCPFRGTFAEISAGHLNVAPPSLCQQVPELSPTVEQVVMQALSKNPAERYATVLDFADAFEAAILPQSLRLFATTESRAAVAGPRSLHAEATVPVEQPQEAAPVPLDKAPAARFFVTSRRNVLLSISGLVTLAAAGTGLTWLLRFSHPVMAKPGAQIKPPPAPTPTPIPVGTVLRPYYGHFGYVYSVAWSSDDSRIASGSDDHTVHVWDSSSGADVIPTYSNHNDSVRSVAWSPDGTLIASASADRTVQVWKASDESSVYTYTGHTLGVNSAAWSPDGTLIASASVDKTVQVWQAAGGGGALTYNNHTDAVNAVAWSPDGTLIASASNDKTVQVWKAADGSNVLTYSTHTDAVNAVAWSPDGTLIASASNDKTVQVWKAADGSNVLTYSGHSDVVNCVAWSPDGSLIASGSNDKTVHIWKAADASDIYTFSGHSDVVNCAAWSHDGSLIASGSNDKTVQVWQAT